MSRVRKPYRPRDNAATRYIYTISGSAGVYVGCTRRPSARWSGHKLAARRAEYGWTFPQLYGPMAAEGADAYRFEVIACARGAARGVHAEHQVIAQLKAAGVRVLNRRQAPPGAVMRAALSAAELTPNPHPGA